jgi:hypothetical protein
MSTPPPLEEQETEPVQGRWRWGSLGALPRELILIGAALIVGLLVMPLVIWAGGNRVLGGYTQGTNLHAGPLALLSDFFTGLANGSTVFWGVALGPLIVLLFLQGLVRLLRLGSPHAD